MINSISGISTSSMFCSSVDEDMVRAGSVKVSGCWITSPSSCKKMSAASTDCQLLTPLSLTSVSQCLRTPLPLPASRFCAQRLPADLLHSALPSVGTVGMWWRQKKIWLVRSGKSGRSADGKGYRATGLEPAALAAVLPGRVSRHCARE